MATLYLKLITDELANLQSVTPNQLQQLIHLAQDIKETSWDARLRCYKINNEAAARIANPHFAKAIYLLNELAWNDAQDICNR